jgi:hypothetical protein
MRPSTPSVADLRVVLGGGGGGGGGTNNVAPILGDTTVVVELR